METDEYRGYRIEILESAAEALEGPAPSGRAVFLSSRGDRPAPSLAEAMPETAEAPVLMIDGAPLPYTRSEAGFHIYYTPPADSLMEAARAFLDAQPERAQ